MKNLAVILSLFFVSAAGAGDLVTSYSCDVVILAKDLPGGSTKRNFIRPVIANGSHGGTPEEFAEGDHKVAILADSKWRAIRWDHKGRTVAEVLTAGVNPINANSVVIVYNPADKDEQVYLSCDALPGAFPNE